MKTSDILLRLETKIDDLGRGQDEIRKQETEHYIEVIKNACRVEVDSTRLVETLRQEASIRLAKIEGMIGDLKLADEKVSGRLTTTEAKTRWQRWGSTLIPGLLFVIAVGMGAQTITQCGNGNQAGNEKTTQTDLRLPGPAPSTSGR